MTKTYRLKAMVLVRMLSEVTLFLVFIASPVVLAALGKFMQLSVPGRAVFITLSIIGLVLLPIYGFITWQVKTDLLGITTISLFKRQFCEWSLVRSLSRRSSWNWLRYVVETQEGEISFPVLLKDCELLVDDIRSRLPAAGPSTRNAGSTKLFEHDRVAAFWQVAQIFYGFVFLGITWSFFASIHAKSSSDYWSLLAFCVAVSALLLWRTVVVALMPRSVKVTDDSLTMRNFFFERSFAWSDLRGIKAASPFLPEGFEIKTRKMAYLVGSNMNEADELQEILLKKIPPPPEKKDTKSGAN